MTSAGSRDLSCVTLRVFFDLAKVGDGTQPAGSVDGPLLHDGCWSGSTFCPPPAGSLGVC